MGDGPPRFRRNFTCSAPYSGIHSRERSFDYGSCYPLRRTFPGPLRLPRSFVTPYRMSYNPKRQASWFGLCSVSLAATQEIAFCFLFLQVLRCFSSLGLSSLTLCIQIRIPFHYVWWVSPFGNLRIKAYLQLPEAYRR